MSIDTVKCKMVSFSRSVWKKLHRAEKIYTGSARGAPNNYEVCVLAAFVTNKYMNIV